MKKLLYLPSIVLFAFVVLATSPVFSQSVSINEDGSAADGSAILDVKSTDKGLLVPRMTAAERGGIGSPATGLIVYQTDGALGFYYNAGTPGAPAWVLLIAGPIEGSDIASGVQTTTNTTLALGNDNNSAAELRLLEPSGSGVNYSALKAGPQSTDVTYTLPNAAPSSNGQVLSGNTDGTLSWSSGGGTVSTNATINGDGSGGSPLGINLGNANTWTANQNFASSFLITSNARIAMTNSDNLARDIRFQEPSGTGTQYIGLYAPNLSNNGNYRLPAAVGSVGQSLQIQTTNGIDSASLVWADASGGGTVNTNATLNGDGSAGSPLGINLARSNTWTSNQTFSGSFLITQNANIAMTNNNNQSGELRIQEPSGTGSLYVGFRAPVLTKNGRYTFPAVVGSVGQVLKIGSVVTMPGQDEADLVWGDASGGGGSVSARVRAYRNADFAAAFTSVAGPLTWTTIPFNAEDYDTGGEFNTSNGTFTASAAGYYLISAAHSSDSSIGGKMIRITVNGTSIAHGASNAGNGGVTVTSHVSTVLQLSAGDVVRIQAAGFNGGGGNFTIKGSPDETYVQITRLQ